MKSSKRLKAVAFPLIAAMLSTLMVGCGGQSQVDVEDAELTQLESIFDAGPGVELQSVTPDTVIARVNGKDIAFAELEVQLKDFMRRSAPNISREDLERDSPGIVASILENLIMAQLIEDAVASEEIEVREDEVIIRLRQIASQIPEGRRLSEILEDTGISMDDFKEGIRNELETQKLIDKRVADIPEISEDEIIQFYQANQQAFAVPESAEARHIFAAFKPEDGPQQKGEQLDRIIGLRSRILNGDAVFEEIAREHSDAPSGQDDGKLGTIYRGQMLPNIDEAVFSQTIGEIGEPVETAYGYHIIRVDERMPARTLALNEAGEDIRNHLDGIKRQSAINAYLEQLYSEATVEILRDPQTISLNF